MSLFLTAAPETPVVNLVDMKAYLRVEHDVENELIEGLIAAAVQHFDGRDGVLGRALHQQSWEYRLRRFWGKQIRIPLPPLVSVDSVQYYDDNNALQTLVTSRYETVGIGGQQCGAIRLQDGETWPTVYDRGEAVIISFTAGYAVNSSPVEGAVPQPIRIAIMMLVAHWYVNRIAVADKVMMPVPMAVSTLTNTFRVMV
jgi:uncharacterized phiE125 gp8 family phage protein